MGEGSLSLRIFRVKHIMNEPTKYSSELRASKPWRHANFRFGTALHMALGLWSFRLEYLVERLEASVFGCKQVVFDSL